MAFWTELYQTLFKNLISKKFQAFVVCSIFFANGIMSEKAFLIIACAYMGSNILQKISASFGNVGDKK